MNYVISIINPYGTRILAHICEELNLPLTLTHIGHGTATKTMLDLLGIESKEKRVVIAVANDEQTSKLIAAQRERLYIDAPGNGIVISVPIKSVGGGKTLAYLSGGTNERKAPDLNFGFELILAITNEGQTETVMDAARKAGASGGTILHAKGTASKDAEKFFNVSIANEKEIVLIVAKSSEKADIMSSILKFAGPDSEAGAIVFSLPINAAAGFKMTGEA